MPSARDKRATARARLEQRMAEKAAAAQKRRKIKMTVASAITTVLVLGLGTFLVVNLVKDKDATCNYSSAQGSGGENPAVLATGKPSEEAPDNGTQDFTMALNTGDVVIQMNLEKAPCTAHSFDYLSSKNYFTNTTCHRVTTEGLYVLQCGDPNGDGSGGPSYGIPDENLPADDPSLGGGSYPAGIVAMAEASGKDPGSQFFIVYKDTVLPPNYTRLGVVTSGLDVVQAIADKGAVKNGEPATDGSPVDPVTITGTSVSAPNPDGVPATPRPVPSTSGSPSTEPEDQPSEG